MDELKMRIAGTIEMPNFLYNVDGPDKDLIIATAFKLLDLHYKGVEAAFMTDEQIRRVLRRVDSYDLKLRAYASPRVCLKTWIWIGQTVGEWINDAIELEEFEVATNLRKIINSEYA